MGPGLEKASWSGPVAGWKGMRSNRGSGCMNTQCCMIRDSARAPSEYGAYTQAGRRAWQTGPWPESPASAAAQESAEPRTSLEAGHIPAFPQAALQASAAEPEPGPTARSAQASSLSRLWPLGGSALGRDGGSPAPLPRSGVSGDWEGDLGPESLQVHPKEVWGQGAPTAAAAARVGSEARPRLAARPCLPLLPCPSEIWEPRHFLSPAPM